MVLQVLEVKGLVKQGNDVWVRANVTVLDGAILAAGLVTKPDVAENATEAGVPAWQIRIRT